MDAIPSELVLHILKQLEYGDLKYRAHEVCAKFKALTEATKYGYIDQVLFRDLPAFIQPHTFFIAHPVFKFLDINSCVKGIDEVNLGTCNCCRYFGNRSKALQFEPLTDCECDSLDKETTLYRLVDLEVVDENAISPAVHQAILHVAEFPPFEIRSKDRDIPIKVGDIVKRILEFLQQKVTIKDFEAAWGHLHNLPTYPLIAQLVLPRQRARTLHLFRSCSWTGVHDIRMVEELEKPRILHLYFFSDLMIRSA